MRGRIKNEGEANQGLPDFSYPSHPFSPSPQPRGRKEKGWLSLNKIGRRRTEKREGVASEEKGGWLAGG